MPNARQALLQLLADGEVEKTLAGLKNIFEKNGDQACISDVVGLSSRFNQAKNGFHRGILSQEDFNLENNKITSAILNLIKNLPEPADFSTGTKTAAGKIKWKKWALILGIFAAVAGITGYTLRDFFKKQAPVQAPAVEKPAEPLAQPAEKPATEKAGKNSPNITVKDKGKVGIINTGDSAVFKDIKQEF